LEIKKSVFIKKKIFAYIHKFFTAKEITLLSALLKIQNRELVGLYD